MAIRSLFFHSFLSQDLLQHCSRRLQNKISIKLKTSNIKLQTSNNLKMPHIDLKNDLPGIRSLATFRPETGRPLYELAQILLRGDSPLSEAERELIAAYVSSRNNTMFCVMSHA